jgi:formate dehydrogenase (coenzyme F420) beta subunit
VANTDIKQLCGLLHEQVQAVLPELETVIGWTQGYDPLHTTPVFIRDARSISKLIWNPFCSQNLTGYLVKTPAVQATDKAKKIGVCVKGCDSRSLVALIQEKFVSRESLYILGFPCHGVIDWHRVMLKVPTAGILMATVEDGQLILEHDGGLQHLELADVLARKCLRCAYPNPVIHDILIGKPTTPRVTVENAYRDVEELEQRPLAERLDFWRSELERCMRCYACRNACPLCVCQERCIAETREPRWLTQYMSISEKYLFHFIHALHLAGRCTECGECERVCPMEIPVTLMKEELSKIIRELLGYEAGVSLEAVPPLLTFSPEETSI